MPDRRRLVLILCCVAQFMVVLDVSVVNVALPSIRTDLGFSDVDLQWIVNAYTLTFAGFLLLGGRAADLIGHRPVFVAGITLFGLASLAGGLSQGQVELVIARAAQGLGGAIVAPATLSVLTTTFKEGEGRNTALAAWGAMGAVGGATGGIVGGVLTDLLGWQWILFINVPVAIAAVLAALRLLERPEPGTGKRHYDAAGAVTVTVGLVVLTFGIVRTEVEGWGAPITIATLAGGLALLALFLLIEARFSPRPLMPLRIFRSRSVSAANVVVFFLGAAAFSMWFLTSLYMQRVLGFSPIKAGLSFLPMSLTIAVVSTVIGRVGGRAGAGKLLTGGMALIALGMALFSFVSPDGSWHADVLVPGVVVAAGIGCSFVTVTIAATNGIAPQEAGLASGLVNTSRQFGGSVGLAVLATVASAKAGGGSAAALTDGYSAAYLIGAAFALCGSLTAAFALIRAPRRVPEPVRA